ncbi:hypothetical protein NP493_231g01014 [Ridgeia piscesae]|uniref:Nucleoporin Nup37 n=1 Tax=Ridgeia piscesae TaxID=27915 RepID=A0AAD9NZT9_RIDPI|nr:hypothetical protein NP493_231g01014 [Ridgeia piscesae]
MPEGSTTTSTYTIDAPDTVHLVEFSPFEWSSQLLAIGTATRVTIGTCRFQEESSEVSGVEFEVVQSYQHASLITALAWSPETSISIMPKVIKFCTAGVDRKVTLFSSDLKSDVNMQMLGEHRDYVNDISFHPDKGELIASVSDDHTCCVWSVEGSQVACFPLGAPGMAVAWHEEEPAKLMVAEKKGIIRFYNVQSQHPIMSLDCGHMPLMSADWCHGNSLQVAAAASTDWFVFDTSRSSQPIENKQSHPSMCQQIRWSKSHDHLLATKGGNCSQLKVFNIRSNQVTFSKEFTISNGLAWHFKLPLVAVGVDKKVHFYSVAVL